MTFLQKNKDREHFLKCRVCGDDLDLWKPREVFDHSHDSIFHYVEDIWYPKMYINDRINGNGDIYLCVKAILN